MGRRPLFWEGSAKRDFKQFPEAVQKDMGCRPLRGAAWRDATICKTLEGARARCL
jgi:hypothetical protein